MSIENKRLRILLELAENDFSPEKFNDALLNETKNLIKKHSIPEIGCFLQDNFGITQPIFDGDKLLFRVQNSSGFIELSLDVDGNILLGN
tara:strand:+ start:159 stop:428 length:270 start_codon:yes stop_codon:yes gene_type:complete